MQNFTQPINKNPEYYKKTIYTKSLKKDSTKLGFLLIITEVLAFAISLGVAYTFGDRLDNNSTTLFIEQGLYSLIMFFIPGLIFILINRYKINEILPFSKDTKKLNTLFIFFGLGVSLASNYISQLFSDIWSIFGANSSVDIEMQAKEPIDIALYFITVAIIPALVEEFVFRGVIQGVLCRYSASLSILISGLLFGLMHANFGQITFAIPVGLIFGYIRIKSNSMLPTMIIHCANNGISVLFDILNTNGYFSDTINGYISILLIFIITILAILSLIILIIKDKKQNLGLFKFDDSNNIITFKEKVKAVCSRATMIIFTCFVLFEAILTAYL